LILCRHKRRRGVARAPQDHAIGAIHLSIVTETYPPEINGVAHTLGRLIDRLRRAGYHLSVVRPRQRGDGGDGVSRDELLVRGIAMPGYAGLQIGLARPRTLCRYWRAHRPDAIYVATEGPLGWAAVMAARRLGIRVVSGFHTNFHAYTRHYRIGLLEPLVRAGLTAFHRRTDGVLVASAGVGDALCRGGVTRVDVIGRGVDGSLFDPARRCRDLRASWGATDQDVVAIAVGRMAPEKNVPLAIEAFRAMQRVAPGSRCVLVGDGPARAALEAAHRDIAFAGLRSGQDLARHYASADLFLFPSLTETFGNVTLEAMSSGLAVVAFDYAAAHQHISHGETGLLAPFGDGRAFVRLTVDATRRRAHLAELGRAARARVAVLDWDAVARRFAGLVLGETRDAARTTALRYAVPKMEDAT
jgi:glycosyltransferase involved in cell wall biosynthesis